MNLQIVKEKLEAIPELSVSERGTGNVEFLYVQSSRRAVEVDETPEGIWIEYWDDTDKEDEKCVKEETVTTSEEALAKIKRWLTAR
jgi:hypothetical protein